MVGDQHDRPAVASGSVEEVERVGDVDEPPPGAVALPAVVESIVDRVQHDADRDVVIGQSFDERLGEPTARMPGYVCLVHEQGAPSMAAPERCETLALLAGVTDSRSPRKKARRGSHE